MNSKKATALGLVLALGMSVSACAGKEEAVQETEESVAVEVQTPKIGSLTLDTAYIGTVMPQEQVYVIPKTSGTVTETFFEVGDQVQAGDVLFKIDDEAAQLQMANARAAYESAQAGVTAQNGGARDLQNYQTEEQIRQLRESLYDTDDQIAELEDNLGDLRDAGGKLSSAKEQAQAGVDAAAKIYYEKQNEISDQIKVLQEEIDALQEADKNADVSAQEGEIASLQAELAGYKAAVDQARAGVDQIQAQLDSIDASKAQIKSGIDQAENGQDTIRDNLSMAEQAYAITQNEIYPQSDAVSAAQLQQASVGIDSAQMQLDFCTVTSPISGIVESVSVEKNGMASAGNPAYIISNRESMTVTFFVAEKAKNVLNIGDPITIERNEHIYDGAITEIGTMANAQTKLFQVKASIAGAGVGENALPNGVSVKVYATTEKEDSKLMIPYDSIYFSAGDAYVYCVENGQIVRKEVTVGLMSDEEAVIEEGLTEDSQVVSNWSSKLRNGVEADVVSVNGEAVVTDEPAETQETEAENAETEDEKEAADSEGAEGEEVSDDEETADSKNVTEEAE
ncbi:MAG: efflux RND transporter periplasmic adaptor subunit [Lachnospiraceae bacterium]|jgi:RND family efflux transporter MFP subunit|nr:efflux RND transporter periplasmic adaptor subunit [Lachnospiraceae bacterium]